MVFIDAYTKWVEAFAIGDLSSWTVLGVFVSEIVARYGTPAVVRSDRGTEFEGVFAEYLREKGIYHAVISTAHPRANGLVERYNGIIIDGFRRFTTMMPEGYWWEFLPDVLAGLR